MRPSGASCSKSGGGTAGPPAVTMMRSNGASSGHPSVPLPARTGSLELRGERGAPVREARERGVVGEVELDGRHGDVALVDRAHVGAFERFPRRLAAAEPVVRAAAGILLLDDLVAVDAVPE